MATPRQTSTGRARGAAPPPESGAARGCDHPGCAGEGLYKAPRSPEALRSYYWFCLDHVRDYNRAWNFCAGRTAEEVEAFLRQDTVGWRPTWPMSGAYGFARISRERLRDPFRFFAGGARRAGADGADGAETGDAAWPRGAKERRALALFDLEPPVTSRALKERYKELAKRHHPDATGGDKASEEKLKLINEAYRVLKLAFAF